MDIHMLITIFWIS